MSGKGFSPSSAATDAAARAPDPDRGRDTRRCSEPSPGSAGYAELHCLSNFSFLRGAASAGELFERARACGYSALAITDECSLAGIVRGHEAARATGLKLIVGSEIQLADAVPNALDGLASSAANAVGAGDKGQDRNQAASPARSGPRLVLLCQDQAGYTRLCQLITTGRRAAAKGEYRLTIDDIADGLPGLLVLWLPGQPAAMAEGRWLRQRFGDRLWLAVELHAGPDDGDRLRELEAVGQALAIPRVAAGDVHMHSRGRRALQDVMTAIRLRRTVVAAGARLFRNGERHLRTLPALASIYPASLLAETLGIAERCQFSLEQLRYRYPSELVPAGWSAADWLAELTRRGCRERWPAGVPDKVQAQIEYELALISELAYESYFLTVHDIVRFARSRGILCQGRGSAANSSVCFALGVTEVDPARHQLLVERFISRERGEPPDIDIDFEHERREEVLQYIYATYGRDRAALAATVICYRSRSAVRDVARALGLPADQVDRLSAVYGRGQDQVPLAQRLRESGFDPDSPLIRRVMVLAGQLQGFPRHLSQHVGGFVISDAPLATLVPVENAAMPGRTLIQWDKDDLDAMGLLKVDCLALGMLTCIRKCFDLVKAGGGPALTMATLPPEDQATYRMIQRADTLGVFQIESRAQMAMLPRLRPRNFQDLVIQVAIVRPGPIQGDMVHPYLRRRRGEEKVDYPSPELRKVLERTLGVPLFQEQVMQLAVVAAGYTPGQADGLRRSMAAWRRNGDLEQHRQQLLAGMSARGYSPEFAQRLFEQMKGFGSYGFPESHAASFAGIVYASAWLKCHYPAAFACALLNAQPMGFYAPAQIVADARRHGIRVLPVDVRDSDWDCRLAARAGEPVDSSAAPDLRLGLRLLRGLRETVARQIMQERTRAPFVDLADLCGRCAVDRQQQDILARGGALRGLAGHRHRAHWAVAGLPPQLPLFGHAGPQERAVVLPPPTQAQDTLADYRSSGLSLGPHPLRQLRPRLRAAGCQDSRQLAGRGNGSLVRVAGLVSHRQQPATASGVTFISMEDEHGLVNIIVHPAVATRWRLPFLQARLLAVVGTWQMADGVGQLVAQRLADLDHLLPGLDARSRDFC
ncbi:MAG: error-prone DNA polymerase [Lysobacterales bacterium]